MKRCSKCQNYKSRQEFFRRSRSADGLQVWCKACFSTPEMAESKRLRMAALPREEEKAKARIRRIKNPELYRKLDSQRYERDRVKRIVLAAHYADQRRIRKTSTISKPYSRAKVLEKSNRICFYCFRAGANTIDHVFPISPQTGVQHGIDASWNLVVACGTCNSSKGNRSPWEFLGRQGATLDDIRWATLEKMSAWCWIYNEDLPAFADKIKGKSLAEVGAILDQEILALASGAP